MLNVRYLPRFEERLWYQIFRAQKNFNNFYNLNNYWELRAYYFNKVDYIFRTDILLIVSIMFALLMLNDTHN